MAHWPKTSSTTRCRSRFENPTCNEAITSLRKRFASVSHGFAAFRGRFASVSRAFRGRFAGVLLAFRRRYVGVTWALRGRYAVVTRALSAAFRGRFRPIHLRTNRSTPWSRTISTFGGGVT